MKLKILTIHSDETKEKTKPLRDSCEAHGLELIELIYGFTFGQQYHLIAEWIRTYEGDATHFLYTDAWDTLCFANQAEIVTKFKAFNCNMLISAEKGCFPRMNEHQPENYPETNTPWRFINGGGSLFEINYFKELSNKYPFEPNYIDPIWLFNCFRNEPSIKLDNNCEIFQTIAHSNQDEWQVINHRVINKGTQTKPIFFHGNGHTEMNWLRDASQRQIDALKEIWEGASNS